MQQVADIVVKYWVQELMALIAGLLALGYRRLAKRLNKASAENEALKFGMRALLRDRLIQQYNHYMEVGRWPIYAREAMLDMYKQYKALGGNGAIASIIQDLEDLPTDNKRFGGK